MLGRALYLATALLALGLETASPAWAACSPYVGSVVLNEYAYQLTYAEIMRLNTNINTSNWSIRIYDSKGLVGSGSIDPACNSPYYQVMTFSKTPIEADVVLFDQNGNVVDILRTRTGTTFTPFYSPYPSCSYVTSTDLANVNAAQKGVDRMPDGFGDWRNTPGVGSNSYVTRCDINKSDGLPADLQVTKTVNPAQAAIGQAITFTITATNNGPSYPALAIRVSDQLPAGLTYVSSNVSTGSYNTATGIWAISSLNVGASATLTLQAIGPVEGTYINTAKGLSNNIDDNTANNTASATVTVLPPLGGFNAVDIGDNALTGRIRTKLAGQPFNLDVVALNNTQTAVLTNFTGNVKVELLDARNNTGAMDAFGCRSSWAPIQTLSPDPAFVAANSGRLAVPFLRNDAWRDLRVRVTSPATGAPKVVGCSRDNFAIRPQALGVTSSANADATGGNVNAAPVFKAGSGSFSLTATAVAGYDGTPQLRAAPNPAQAHAGAVRNGSVSGAFAAAAAATGIATGNFAYDEAGYFRLDTGGVRDTGFTAVDQPGDCSNDLSNSLVAGLYGCLFGNTAPTAYFGRFIPDHFALTPGSLTPGCGSFTYYGQDFTTAFTLTAQNAANLTTQNYAGGFAKLDPSFWTGYAFAASSGSLVQGGSNPSGTWNAGQAAISASQRITRVAAVSPQAPASVTITAKPTDSDGVTLAVPAAVNAVPALQRFGRLRLTNALGSELLDLPVPLTAEYWSGSAFLGNSDDSCTPVSPPASGTGLTFYAPPDTARNRLAAGETTATVSASGHLVAGNGRLRLSKPGPGNFGFVDVQVAAPTWLRYNWGGCQGQSQNSLFDDHPCARASFGTSKSPYLFLRENY